MKRNIYKILTLLAIPLIMAGCRKDLCYDHYDASNPNSISLDIEWLLEWELGSEFNWAANWENLGADNDYEYFRPKQPEGIAVILYDEIDEEHTYNRELHLPASGGSITLDETTRALLIHNDDSEFIIISETKNPDNAYASTRSVSRSAFDDFHAGEKTMTEPDNLYGAFVEIEGINSEEGVRSAPRISLRPLVYSYVLRFKIDKNRACIAGARGAIAGLPDRIFLKDATTGTGSATILFDGSVTSYGIGTHIVTFGAHNPRNDSDYDDSSRKRYDLKLEILFYNGNSLSYEFDITDQIEKQPQGGVIILEDLDIPDEIARNGSGFQPNVDEWGDENDVTLPL